MEIAVDLHREIRQELFRLALVKLAVVEDCSRVRPSC